MPEHKQLWLLAGGNGAGKSTFYRMALEPHGIPFINADVIARQLDPAHSEAVSYEAARIAETLRGILLQQGRSFCFETVFSHPSKIDFTAQAKAQGYEVILVYIHLQHPQLNQARVVQRVSEGGHPVPAEKIVSRLPRTLQHVRTALPLADRVQVYDNSSRSEPFIPIASLREGALTHTADPLPDWAAELLADYR